MSENESIRPVSARNGTCQLVCKGVIRNVKQIDFVFRLLLIEFAAQFFKSSLFVAAVGMPDRNRFSLGKKRRNKKQNR